MVSAEGYQPEPLKTIEQLIFVSQKKARRKRALAAKLYPEAYRRITFATNDFSTPKPISSAALSMSGAKKRSLS